MPPSLCNEGPHEVSPLRVSVLNDIWLSFYHGAKIGSSGLTAQEKSSLMRIMAGLDKDSTVEAWSAQGIKVGFLSQEPQLDPTLDVKGNVELAVKPQRDLLKRFDEISLAFAEPMDDAAMQKLLDEQTRVQERIDALDLWNLDNKIEIAMDALRLPPADADVARLSGGEKRRVALCRILIRATRPLVARRADESPRRRVGQLAGAAPGGVPRHGGGRHARSLLPRQRRQVDPRARSRIGIPIRRQLHELAGTEEEAAGNRREADIRAATHARARAGLGAHGSARSSGKEQGAHSAVRALASKAGGTNRPERDRDPTTRALWQRRVTQRG